ncbi:MAG: hypothetical protein GF350_00230, partial [Chitinivibrionales bacterium]|nr:hypothetical protein [Chitinivibrionales bacterium]
TVEGRTPVFSGSARCPVFNHNGDSLAFQRREGGKTYISVMSITGGAAEDIIENDVTMFYMDWPQGDYIYYNMGWAWPTNPDGKIIRRVNIHSGDSEPVIEFTAKTDGELRSLFHWQMSIDGQRLGITGFPTQMCVYDFSWNTAEIDKCLDGCSFGISPDGQYKTNNMEEAGVTSHRTYRVLTFDGVEQARFDVDQTIGTGSYFNWHHFGVNSNDWVIVPQGWGYQLDRGMNMTLHNWKTGTIILVTRNGENTDVYDFPADFWEGDPDSKTGSLQQLEPPVITPAGGDFNDPFDVSISHGRAGADIFYTTDGNDPDQSSQPYTAPFETTPPSQGIVTVKARAYDQGWEPSEIAYAEYQKPDPMPPDQIIRVLYPNSENQTFTIGETIHIRWEADTFEVSNVMVFAAVDIQKTWVPIADSSIWYGTNEWDNFLWTIPDSLDGVSAITNTALIRVNKYGTYIGDECDYPFQITGTGSNVRIAPPHTSGVAVSGNTIRTAIRLYQQNEVRGTIRLTNLQGQTVWILNPPHAATSLQIPRLPSNGMYLLTTESKNRLYVLRVPVMDCR